MDTTALHASCHTWEPLSTTCSARIGGVVAVQLAVLRFPIVLGERPSGILAAVSPRAALVAVGYGHCVRPRDGRPLRAHEVIGRWVGSELRQLGCQLTQ